MNEPLKDFFAALTDEEGMFVPLFAADNLGILLRGSINELDWYSYNLARAHQPTEEQYEQFYLLRIGATRLIKLALEARPSFDAPTVTFRRYRQLTIQVLEVAAGLGIVEHGRRVAQATMSGLGRIRREKTSEFVITLPKVLPDDGYYERAVLEHYQSEERKKFQEKLNSEFGKELNAEVEGLLSKLVYPFAGSFIGYDAVPALDNYFFGLASNEIQIAEGYDSFHYATKFGGVAFQKYKIALIYLVSLAMRHERFAEALVKKVSAIRLEDVLTVSAETAPFISDMKDALNYFGSFFEGFEETTSDEAATIFSVFSVSRKNTTLLDRPGAPLPLLIQCSDHDVIRCQSAAKQDPMHFLLFSLRHHFPREYDGHQRGREAAMQAGIKRVLNGLLPNLRYQENVKVKKNGHVLTDIDMVVTEEDTGTVLLLQLKHQELYGLDIHSMNTRGARLKEQVERWLVVVKDWTNQAGEHAVRSTLKHSTMSGPMHLSRLVVTRHYSYPLRDIARYEDVAFANWNQFFNAVQLVKQAGGNYKLTDLIVRLKEHEAPAGRQEYLPEPRSEWGLRDLRFTTVQEG